MSYFTCADGSEPPSGGHMLWTLPTVGMDSQWFSHNSCQDPLTGSPELRTAVCIHVSGKKKLTAVLGFEPFSLV